MEPSTVTHTVLTNTDQDVAESKGHSPKGRRLHSQERSRLSSFPENHLTVEASRLSTKLPNTPNVYMPLITHFSLLGTVSPTELLPNITSSEQPLLTLSPPQEEVILPSLWIFHDHVLASIGYLF